MYILKDSHIDPIGICELTFATAHDALFALAWHHEMAAISWCRLWDPERNLLLSFQV
jgi:hypothetical protein